MLNYFRCALRKHSLKITASGASLFPAPNHESDSWLSEATSFSSSTKSLAGSTSWPGPCRSTHRRSRTGNDEGTSLSLRFKDLDLMKIWWITCVFCFIQCGWPQFRFPRSQLDWIHCLQCVQRWAILGALYTGACKLTAFRFSNLFVKNDTLNV